MKRFVVDQVGFVQVEATRRFLVEVPDHVTEEQAQELVLQSEDTFPADDEMAWTDDGIRNWVGYDVEIENTEVYEPTEMMSAPPLEGLTVIKLQELEA